MASVSTYLNFERSTEEAFTFYKSVFGTEFAGPIMRHGDVPSQDGMPELSDEDKRLVMNIALPILAGHLLMGTDIPASMGMALNKGNDVTIGLHPDSRDEADRPLRRLVGGGHGRAADARCVLGRLLRRFHRQVRHPLDDQLLDPIVGPSGRRRALASPAP
jgi:PhnB protein